jgi:hypothetical protein
MEWSFLLALICPIMMLFMMKGMHGKNKNPDKHQNHEIKVLQQQVFDLNQQVRELKNETNPMN